MAYRLLLTVRPIPAAEEIPALRSYLEKAFPHADNLPYLDILNGRAERPLPPHVMAERLGALALLPSLLEGAGISSEDLILRRDGNGRPYCEREGVPVEFDFNLSHAAGHIAGALLVGGGRVGVDVEEFISPARALPLIRRYCTDGELALLKELPPDEETAARFFTSTWVEREAIAKQDGGGMPLRFDTAALPEGVMLWSGYLPDTETALAVCAPLRNAPVRPYILPSSLTVVFP